MIVLGKTTDDLGAQLERLTKRILTHYGYVNLAVNVVTAGGQELDVTGDIEVPVPGSPRSRRLVAECKAYQTPVAITDWLKFLGKVLVEETRLKQEVTGLFVALSGVNGNVRGSYDEICQHRSNIVLLAADNLMTEVQALYSALQSARAVDRLRSLTSKQHLSLEFAYYDEQIYWIALFPDSEYGILTGNGALLTDAQEQTLKPLVQSRLSATTYVNLALEKEAFLKVLSIKKLAVAKLAEQKSQLSISDLFDQSGPDAVLAKRAMEEMRPLPWFEMGSNDANIRSAGLTNTQQYEQLTDLMKFMFNGAIQKDVVRMFYSSDFVQSRINAGFLDFAASIQGNLPLTDTFRSQALSIIKLSPSACLQAITPEPLIVNHRVSSNFGKGTSMIDEEDRRVLLSALLAQLTKDFDNSILNEYFYTTCGLREIETIQQYLVKSANRVEIDASVRMRRGIGVLDNSHGGGYISVLLVDQAPQPWEFGAIGNGKQTGQ